METTKGLRRAKEILEVTTARDPGLALVYVRIGWLLMGYLIGHSKLRGHLGELGGTVTLRHLLLDCEAVAITTARTLWRYQLKVEGLLFLYIIKIVVATRMEIVVNEYLRNNERGEQYKCKDQSTSNYNLGKLVNIYIGERRSIFYEHFLYQYDIVERKRS